MEDCEIERTEENIKFDTIQIEQNNIKFDLNIEVKDNMIIFSINYKSKFPSINYIRKMNFTELVNLHQAFNLFNSFSGFYEFLKASSDKKSISIKQSNDKISLIFNVEVLLEKQIVIIDLFQTKKELDLNIKEIYQELFDIKQSMEALTKDNQYLKEENKKINEDINKLKNENEQLKKKLRNKIKKEIKK